MLGCWNDGATKAAVVDFVQRVTTERGPDFVEPALRVAVFDNDGTLWCEKPMYIQLDFLVRRFAQQAADDPSLRERQPYKAAANGDLQWFGEAVTKHYEGDDSDVKPLIAAVLSAHEAITVDEHAGRVHAFFRDANLFTTAQPEFLDDGPMKPVRLWSRIGRRPILAAGNSNGDIQMLEFTGTPGLPSLCMLIRHDDAEREFDYLEGAERAFLDADKHGWTVVSMKNDWSNVFAD